MIQIAEQTHEEKVAMYMALPKKKIIDMLIECNRILEFRGTQSGAWECPRCFKIHSPFSTHCDCPARTTTSGQTNFIVNPQI